MDNNFDMLLKDPNAVAQLGAAIGIAMGNAGQQNQNAVPGFYGMKEATLPANPGASIYGRNSVFSPCSPGDVFGLQVETHGLMNWLGWRPNKFYSRRIDFVTYIGPDGQNDGTATTGATAPCDMPPGWEYGTCGYNLKHTSWYGRSGDALDPHTVVQERCETSPRYRINGVQIKDDVEWQMNGMMSALSQSIKRDQVHGSHANPNEMNGLNALIKTGYKDDEDKLCPSVDSILVDWAGDTLDGTVNGMGNFFDRLDEYVTEIEWRASFTGGIAETDMVLLTSRFNATNILDGMACYTTCGVTSTNDFTEQSLRAAQQSARRALNGGPLYDGRNAVGHIVLKSGRRLPILVEDALDISKAANGDWQSDVYLLTRKVGSLDVLYGEYLDMRTWAGKLRKADKSFRGRADAIGRYAIKGLEQAFCHQLIIGMSPELYLAAPWAQVRIQDVAAGGRVRKPLTGDAFQTEYHPGYPLYPAYTYDAPLTE